MAAKNKFYKTFYTRAEFEDYISSLMIEYVKDFMEPIKREAINRGLETGLTYGIDMAVLALGRMAEAEYGVKFSETFFAQFLKTVGDASMDYCNLFDVDILENKDEDLWWSSSKMDQELQSYTGDTYPAFKDRYAYKKEEKSE